MKKEHHRKHRETGGVNEAEMDLKTKPEPRTNAKEVDEEAEERKHGGHVKRKSGGKALHGTQKGEGFGFQEEGTKKRRHGGMAKMGKSVGAVHGDGAKHHAGRKPRKAGGKVGSDSHPFTSAFHGTPPKGRKVDLGMD